MKRISTSIQNVNNKVHHIALLPPVLAVISYLLSPEYLGLLPEKYAHPLGVLSVIWAGYLKSFKKEG